MGPAILLMLFSRGLSLQQNAEKLFVREHWESEHLKVVKHSAKFIF